MFERLLLLLMLSSSLLKCALDSTSVTTAAICTCISSRAREGVDPAWAHCAGTGFEYGDPKRASAAAPEVGGKEGTGPAAASCNSACEP